MNPDKGSRSVRTYIMTDSETIDKRLIYLLTTPNARPLLRSHLWYVKRILLFFNILNIIVALDYIWLLLYYPQGGTSVTCYTLCALVEPYCAISSHGLPSLSIPMLASTFWAGVVEGFGWCGGFDWVWVPLGALTWIGLDRPRLPIAGAGRLSYAPATWNHGCTGVWPAPKWWKSYSWRIRTSVSRVAATLLQGDWKSSSG